MSEEKAPDMQEYRVGALYHPGRTSWPEAVEYNYRSGGHELRLFLSRLTSTDIRAIREGPMRVGVYVASPLLLFLYSFGTAIPLSDAPFSFWRVPENERTVPPVLGPKERALLSVVLTEANTGIIRALRTVSLSAQVSGILHDAIRAQASTPEDARASDALLRGLYARYTSEQLWHRAQATCSL